MPTDIRTSQVPSSAASVEKGGFSTPPKQPHRQVGECLWGRRGRQEQADRHTCLIPFLLIILERIVGAGFPLLPSQPEEEETCAGEIGGWRDSLRSSSIQYSISLDLFQRLWKESGSDRYRMEFGNKVEQQHAARTERRAERGRGGTLSYEGVPVAESDVC